MFDSELASVVEPDASTNASSVVAALNGIAVQSVPALQRSPVGLVGVYVYVAARPAVVEQRATAARPMRTRRDREKGRIMSRLLEFVGNRFPLAVVFILNVLCGEREKFFNLKLVLA